MIEKLGLVKKAYKNHLESQITMKKWDWKDKHYFQGQETTVSLIKSTMSLQLKTNSLGIEIE